MFRPGCRHHIAYIGAQPNFLIDDLRSSLHLRPVCWRVAEFRPLVTPEPLEIEPKRKITVPVRANAAEEGGADAPWT